MMDALLPQRHIAQTLVAKGGDEVMIVKEHQPQLRAESAWGLTRPPLGAYSTAKLVLGHFV